MVWTKYSTTAASNTSTPPDGAPEGMAANTVNNTMRDMMAEIRLLANCVTGAFSDIASASTVNIGAANNAFLRVTGTTTITAFDSVTPPAWRVLRFAGALTLTHNAGSLILPGGANITTAANDTCMAVSLGSGNWIVVWYSRAKSVFIPTDTSIPTVGMYLNAANYIGWATNGAFNMGLDSSGNLGIAGALAATGGITGTTTNNSAGAGIVGELISSIVVSGSAISLTSGVVANVTSISLTAGDWDVSALTTFNGGATTTVTYLQASLSATSVTLDTTPGKIAGMGFAGAAIFNGSSQNTVDISPYRISLAGTTTYYLTVLSAFGVSTNTAYGIIRARRIR